MTTPKNLKVFSSVFHGLLASAVVYSLLMMISYEYSHESLILLCSSVACACYFGRVLSTWYLPNNCERWFIQPYTVTPIISLLSAVVSGLIFMLATEITASKLNFSNLGGVFVQGILIGLYAFLFTLPVTSIVGLAVALYLYKFGGYKKHFNKR